MSAEPPLPKRLKSAEALAGLPWRDSEPSSSRSKDEQHKLKVVRVGAVINDMDETMELEHVKEERWENEGDQDDETDEEDAEDEEEEEEVANYDRPVDDEETVKETKKEEKEEEEEGEDDSWGSSWPGKAVSGKVQSAHSAGELMRIWLSVVPKSLQRLREQPLPAVLFQVCGWNIWLGSVMDLRCFYKFVSL